MHGLQTIIRTNNDAALAYAQGNGENHLLDAPIATNFDFNIPWDFAADARVLTAYIHKNTKVSDVIKLKQLVAQQHGPKFLVDLQEY